MRENWWEILDGCCRCWRVPKAPPGTKTAVAAAAADRRAGTKTARHGRTNRPQNRIEKVPNVTSETLLELKTWGNWWEIIMMRHTRLLPLLLPLLLLQLTEEYQKHLPAPKQQGTEGRTGRRIAPKKCLTWLLEPLLELKTCGNLWEILDGCCRCCCRCCCCWQKGSKSTSRHQNREARKDAQATESHRKSA